MTDENVGLKIPKDMRTLSLITFCLIGIEYLTSLSNAAERLQQTSAQGIPIDINKANAGTIAVALTGI